MTNTEVAETDLNQPCFRRPDGVGERLLRGAEQDVVFTILTGPVNVNTLVGLRVGGMSTSSPSPPRVDDHGQHFPGSPVWSAR